MAKIEFQGLEEYRARIVDLGINVEGICKYAVYPGADIVINAIKENTPVDTGSLRDSAKLYKFKDDNGYIHTGVYFEGYDEKGTPNPIKARVLESGTSTRRKRPFIRPAVKCVEKAAEFAMEVALNEKINEIMKKKGV